MSTAPTSKQPLVPRPSASLVIVNGRNEVLLVQRNPKTRFFAGVHVFPGGNYDKKQDNSLKMTAIRETFEESGLLIASSETKSPLSNSVLDEARIAIHSQKTRFQDFLNQHNLSANVDSLLPFTEWITPVQAPRRFHTQFYVVFLPSSSSSGFSSGDKQDRIPKPDGGQEVISARFIHPSAALAEFNQGKITFMPPQYYILYTLSKILQGERNTAEQRDKVATLAHGLFGKMVINPVRLGQPDSDGTVILTYEGDEARGGHQGRFHRAEVKLSKGGQSASEIILHRNFDIFTEIDAAAFKIKAAL